MAFLSKASLLGATRPPQETVTVPELGGEVIVRGMTGAERDAFEVAMVEGRGKNRQVNLKNIRARLVAYSCIDQDGARIFSDADIPALGAVRADVLNRIYTKAQRLSGITDEDVDELGTPSPGSPPPTTPTGSDSATSSTASPSSSG